MTIKKRYESLRKKHGLPAFADLDSEFRIASIESPTYILADIREKIMDRIGHLSCVVEEMLQPDANLAALYESRVMDESEKKQLFEIYKKMMAANRHALAISLQNDEKKDAKFIKEFYAEWTGLKPQLANLITKLRESWEKDTEEGEAAGYMG